MCADANNYDTTVHNKRAMIHKNTDMNTAMANIMPLVSVAASGPVLVTAMIVLVLSTTTTKHSFLSLFLRIRKVSSFLGSLVAAIVFLPSALRVITASSSTTLAFI